MDYYDKNKIGDGSITSATLGPELERISRFRQGLDKNSSLSGKHKVSATIDRPKTNQNNYASSPFL